MVWFNPIETNKTAGSGTTFGSNPAIVKINHPNHGMNDDKPDKVTIAGLTGGTDYNGILGSAINGTHDIGNVTIDSYTITLSGDTGTSTGSVGGSAVTATKNIAFEVVQPQIGFMHPEDTSVTHKLTTISKQSINKKSWCPWTILYFERFLILTLHLYWMNLVWKIGRKNY